MKSFLLLSIFALAWGLSKASGEEEPAALTLLKDAVFTKVPSDSLPDNHTSITGRFPRVLCAWMARLQGIISVQGRNRELTSGSCTFRAEGGALRV